MGRERRLGTVMSMRSVWLVVLLSCTQSVRQCWTFSCPSVCQCTSESVRCTRETQMNSEAVPTLPLNLRLSQLPFKELPSRSFKDLLNVSRIEIIQSSSIKRIQSKAFLAISSLTEMLIQNIHNLVIIENGAFTDLPKLRYLSICNTGLNHFPDLTTISSLETYLFLEMGDNMRIENIPSNAFQGITEEYIYMNLVKNGFKEIQSHAFNGTKLDKVILKDNRFLSEIHDDAFEGAAGPSLLDVSSTALRSLPARGLRQLKVLKAQSAPAMKTLPPLENLVDLQEAQLTYPSHCCAFHTWHPINRERLLFGLFKNLTKLCNEDTQLDLTDSSPEAGDLDDISFHYPDLELCVTSTPIKCTPTPDAFNPCEDLLGYSFLRTMAWVVSVFAIGGNLAVLLTLSSSHQKLTVSRFLMCNLAFADLCMGVYLLLIALVDHRSRQEYYNHATDWQTGAGCGVAGFLTVFASELSVYTLTLITVERWHTIAHAMQKNRRLRLREVAVVMVAGWVFSLLVALLPLLGVSSYSKVSICLPMDIETPASQGYVVAMLVLNVAAFVVVCCCYVRIYLSARNPCLKTRHGDAKLAKRMAVLIFTDFLCMAPISFFAISAALRMPLITVSHSKILLILFYPINSLCNPFLYTIFTRAFRRDMCLLMGQCGCCCAWAELCRAQGSAHKNKGSSRRPRASQLHAYHIKLRGFFHKGPT